MTLIADFIRFILHVFYKECAFELVGWRKYEFYGITPLFQCSICKGYDRIGLYHTLMPDNTLQPIPHECLLFPEEKI